MRPGAFEYIRPTNVEEALAAIQQSESAFFYAGGTELLLALKMRVLHAERLIDVKRVPDLDQISASEAGSLSVGSRATHKQIEESALIRSRLPALALLCSQVANIRVRSVGTIGGNICFAEPHADPITLLTALGAKLHFVSAKGNRIVPSDEFVLGEFETARKDDELLVKIEVPVPAGPSVYRRFRHGERPSVGVAMSWQLSKNSRVIECARIRFGALGPRPQRLPALEDALSGVSPAQALSAMSPFLPAVLDELEVISDRHGADDYKRSLACTLLRRCISDAYALTERDWP